MKIKINIKLKMGIVGLAILGLTGCVPAGPEIEPVTIDVLVVDEPNRTCIDNNPLKNAYFGDTHVHTTFSADAYSENVRSTPTDAYNFAQGEEIGLPPYDRDGVALRTAKLDRPLDFTMVSDHAEFFGDIALCSNPESNAYNRLSCQIYRSRSVLTMAMFIVNWTSPQSSPLRQLHCGPGGSDCVDHSITLWQETQLAAEAAYDRSDDCSFTSFV